MFDDEKQFDGRSLYKLYKQCRANNQSTYQVLSAQLDHDHHQHLPYLTYLTFITELQKRFDGGSIKSSFRRCLWLLRSRPHAESS